MQYNGYSLKNAKTVETPDGVSYWGDIYLGDAEIGAAHNRGDGSMMIIHFRPEHAAHSSVVNAEFAERLFTLNDYEAIFKSVELGENQGVSFVIYANPFDMEMYICDHSKTVEALTNELKFKQPGREIVSVEIFRSLDDFIIDSNPDSRESVLDKLRDGKKETPSREPKPKSQKKSGPEH
jgi:hypothetical protein